MPFGKGTMLSGPGMKPRFMQAAALEKAVARGVSRNRRRGTLSRRVRNIDKKVKKIQRSIELGHKDTAQTAVSIPTTGVFVLVNGTAHGDSDLTRTGDEVVATSLQFRYRIEANVLALNATLVRVLLIWDSQANGASPTLATMFDQLFISDPIYAPYNLDYQKRYKFLYDRVHVLNPVLQSAESTGSLDNVVPVSIYKKRKVKLSRTVKYSGGTDVITSIATNSLHMVFISNQSSDTPTVTAGYRFIFKDP